MYPSQENTNENVMEQESESQRRSTTKLSENEGLQLNRNSRFLASTSNLVEGHLEDEANTSTNYAKIPIPPLTINTFSKWIINFQIPQLAFNLIISLLVPVLIWLALFVIIGDEENLPGGSVFVIVVLEFVGRISGYAVSLIKLPPMVGMLGLGILIRNVPYIDFGTHLNPSVSAPIRQISLAIILTRAGMGLDLDVLIKLKWLVARLAFFPTIIEGTTVGLSVRLILGFPWLWSFLVGFVVAAVSPAVIVPRILELKEKGYGIEKGIPTMILASASLDNIVAIAFFGVLSGFIFSTKSFAMTILQGPLEIIIGCGTGICYGFIIGMIFQPSISKNDVDCTVLKIIAVLGGGISMVLGFQKLGYTGAGVLSCLISAFITALIWKKRNVVTHDFENIKWSLTFLWKLFEPLLFGVIGCQIVLSSLDTNVLIYGLCCLLIGTSVRFVTVLLMVSGTGLNLKEKLFVAISWVPKATVQAAIGPMALDLARKSGNIEFEDLGLQVLTFAVLVIILTAPIGELGVILSGPRFLTKSNEEIHSS